MAVKFFGQFMVEKGIVSREALLQAVGLQESTNLRFGETARSMGFITDADIARVNAAQREVDLPFGEMSEKLGIITPDQLKEVLTKQRNSHLYIGEALIKVGAIRAEDLPGHLDAFKADQAPYVIDTVAIPPGVPDPALAELIADLTCKMLSRIAGLTIRTGQCAVVRRLDDNDTVVEMGMSGSIQARYLLSVSGNVRNAIARAVLKTDDVSGESEAMLNDAVMEFVNIICGNMAAKAAQMGKTIEIALPRLIEAKGGIPAPAGGSGLLFPVSIADGRIEIGLFMEKA
jgi:CheY-specific phosphatase CheX